VAVGDLTTLADVKAWLTVPQVADDALLSRLITAASTFIKSWLNRDLLSTSYTIARSGNGGFVLVLPNRPVTAVALVSVGGVALPPSTGPGVSGFRAMEFGVVTDGYRMTRGNANVVVTYTGGYATTPLDIAQACIELVAMRYRERDRIGHQSKTLAGETVSFSLKDMSDSVRTILMQYREIAPV
jgi:hypothetical protein